MTLARLLPLFVAVLLVSCFSAQADEPEPKGPDVSSAQSTDIDIDVESLPPKGPPNLESSLWRLVEAERRGGLGELSAEAQRSAITLHDGAVRVIVEAQPGQASTVAGAATLQGGVIETSYGDLVQVLAPVGTLEALSNTNGVRFVRQPTRYLPAVTGEGVDLVNADDWHAEGITGSGVKVAVLDGGFSDYSSLLGTELPSSVTTQSFRADGRIDLGFDDNPTVHGTAVAEIVHEMAPAAQLYLVNFQTDPELGQAVEWIVSQGVEVINFSVGCTICGPGDGTRFDNDLVTNSVAAGTQWAISSGNQADAHWMGPWTDNNGNDWNDFAQAPFDESNAFAGTAGQPIVIELKWDDPFGASGNDYDLCLADADGFIIICSVGVQDGTQDPVEWIAGPAPYTGTYHILIGRWDADGLANFHLYIWPGTMQYVEAAGSLSIPADNPHAISVGAVNWSSPDTIEVFSSQGPTEDGRTKPDLVAPDFVSGATYGPSGFPGTSASSPHVAGAAALVKQAYAGYTPAQIKSFLEGRAVDLGAAGKDNIYGSGRLDLGDPDGDAAQAVSVGSTTIAIGQQGPVDLQALNMTAPGLGGWDIGITYDAAVVSAVSCTGISLVCNTAVAGTISAIGADANGLIGDTTLATITFECLSVGSSDLTVTADLVDATPGDPQPITAALTNGSVTCGIIGDVNGDGDVTITDLVLIAQFLGGVIGPGDLDLAVADVNGDGDVTITDLVLVAQFLGGVIPSL